MGVGKQGASKHKLPGIETQRAVLLMWMESRDDGKWAWDAGPGFSKHIKQELDVDLKPGDVKLLATMNGWDELRRLKVKHRKAPGKLAQYIWDNRQNLLSDRMTELSQHEIRKMSEVDDDWSPEISEDELTRSAVARKIKEAKLESELLDSTNVVKAAKLTEDLMEMMRKHLQSMVKGTGAVFNGAIGALAKQLQAHNAATEQAINIKRLLASDVKMSKEQEDLLVRRLRALSQDIIHPATLKQIAQLATGLDMGKVQIIWNSLKESSDSESQLIIGWSSSMAAFPVPPMGNTPMQQISDGEDRCDDPEGDLGGMV